MNLLFRTTELLHKQRKLYYRCVEDYFETFVQNYDEHFSRQYGFWRPYVEQVINRYLDCGDLHNGFFIISSRSPQIVNLDEDAGL